LLLLLFHFSPYPSLSPSPFKIWGHSQLLESYSYDLSSDEEGRETVRKGVGGKEVGGGGTTKAEGRNGQKRDITWVAGDTQGAER
jgi:hypothetical protein